MRNKKLSYCVKVAVLTSVSIVLMVMSKLVPVPFFVPFYKFDFSDISALIGGFALGPMASCVIVALKTLANFLLNGSDSGGIGELTMFLCGIAFTLPASLLYRFRHTKSGALWGVIAGTFSLCVCACLMNAYVMIPLYAGLYNTDIEKIVSMATKGWPFINTYPKFIFLITGLFNLIKGSVISVITVLIYKPLSPILKK